MYTLKAETAAVVPEHLSGTSDCNARCLEKHTRDFLLCVFVGLSYGYGVGPRIWSRNKDEEKQQVRKIIAGKQIDRPKNRHIRR